MIPQQWQFLYALNPMAGVIEGFRWALLGTNPPAGMILVSAWVVVLLLLGGLLYFKRMEQYFADVV
jgi:lipopolysaccharide transport system permease protein